MDHHQFPMGPQGPEFHEVMHKIYHILSLGPGLQRIGLPFQPAAAIIIHLTHGPLIRTAKAHAEGHHTVIHITQSLIDLIVDLEPMEVPVQPIRDLIIDLLEGRALNTAILGHRDANSISHAPPPGFGPIHRATPDEATNADASTGAVKPSSPTPVHQTTPDEATNAEASTGAVKPSSPTPTANLSQSVNTALQKAANAGASTEAVNHLPSTPTADLSHNNKHTPRKVTYAGTARDGPSTPSVISQQPTTDVPNRATNAKAVQNGPVEYPNVKRWNAFSINRPFMSPAQKARAYRVYSNVPAVSVAHQHQLGGPSTASANAQQPAQDVPTKATKTPSKAANVNALAKAGPNVEEVPMKASSRLIRVNQEIVPVTGDEDKLKYLAHFFDNEQIPVTKVLILTRDSKAINLLHMSLRGFGLKCSGFCQGYTQQELKIAPTEVIWHYNCPITSFQLLKGLNLPGLETMFVHDMPGEFEEYIAAVGRVGGIGNTGKAIVFFNVERDVAMACPLSDHLKAHGQEVPDWLEAICEKEDLLHNVVK